VTAVDPSTISRAPVSQTFAQELQLRVVEAQANLDAAQRLEDPLLEQIAAADLDDLTALAARNDVPLPE
jgi:hypothetical protein